MFFMRHQLAVVRRDIRIYVASLTLSSCGLMPSLIIAIILAKY